MPQTVSKSHNILATRENQNIHLKKFITFLYIYLKPKMGYIYITKRVIVLSADEIKFNKITIILRYSNHRIH